MKKFTAIIILLLFSTSFVFANGDTLFNSFTQTIKIGSSDFKPDDFNYVKNDRVYVPLRSFCDSIGVPVTWNNETNVVDVNIYNKKISTSQKTEYKDDGVIPDEETALAIGKVLLEKYSGKTMEYETDDKIFYLKAEYIQEINSWDIIQWHDYKDGRKWIASGIYLPKVRINKSTGEVMYINTYSSFESAIRDV